MKLNVYKGFDKYFLDNVDEEPLVEGFISDKKNVLLYDKKTRKSLNAALLSMEDDDSAWMTYEEYTLIKNRIDDAIEEDGLKLTIYRNNLYPDKGARDSYKCRMGKICRSCESYGKHTWSEVCLA